MTSEIDQGIVNAIAQGDKIHSVTIEGDISELMEKVHTYVDKWNAVLDKNFPDLPRVQD